jgi:L-ribulokinase
MGLARGENYVLGLDFGTDSCRALILDAANGEEAGVSVMNYPRWARGLYSDPGENRFRQHPLDYLETLEHTVREAAGKAGPAVTARVKGISVDTTGSTSCAVDSRGLPLALRPEFADKPSAMFVMWKDHTAAAEAELINRVLQSGKHPNYAKYAGGIYSSEWFWARVLRIFNEDAGVAGAAYSFLEHCEWMSALLAGNRDIPGIKRSRTTAGHKALWHRSFGGYPPRAFCEDIDPRLGRIYDTLGRETWPSDTEAGRLSAEWAEKLGLPAGIPVGVGGIDAHFGGVGGGVRPGRMVMVVGTSICEMIVGPRPEAPEKPVRGICGQVDGSIVPGMIGYEAGQSAFGDVYAWFRDLLLWPLEKLLPGAGAGNLSPRAKEDLKGEIAGRLIPEIEKEAEKLEPGAGGLALDWFNGRRSPDADARVKGAITGLGLGTGAVKVYRALAEATAFGARAIVERYREEGIGIEEIHAVGGVARKSPLVMQILADVLNREIRVLKIDQAVALGAAMFAAVVAGLYPDIPAAQTAMASPVERIHRPDPERAGAYQGLYARYRSLGAFEQARA